MYSPVMRVRSLRAIWVVARLPRRPIFVLHGIDFDTGGDFAVLDVLRRNTIGHQFEFQEGRFADESDGALRIFHPRKLDLNPIFSLGSNIGLGHAKLIDAVPDGFQSLSDSQLLDVVHFRRFHAQQHLHPFRTGLPASPLQGGEALVQEVLQLGLLLRSRQLDLDGVAPYLSQSA